MELFEKARILGGAGQYDSCGPKMCEVKVNKGLGGIYHAKANHKSCRMFKTLMDNRCSFDCKYCSNAVGCRKKPASFTQEELPKIFMHLQKTMNVHELFISSAITGNPDTITEKMIGSIRILRQRYHFRGYIHFKVLPGTSYELVKQASELSNRMSINIEAPNKSALSELSGMKDYHGDILKRQSWISRMSLRSGQTTQMMINSLSTDREVLKMTNWEYDTMKLKRVYYSAFRPVKGTPLENEKPETLKRQNRLYKADFLLRDYGYRLRELNSIMDGGMLPQQDPKLVLALETFDSPLDVNEASYSDLIRVPGIGPKSAKRISESRKRIKKYEELQRMGVRIKNAKPFIEVDGKKQKMLACYR